MVIVVLGYCFKMKCYHIVLTIFKAEEKNENVNHYY